MSRIEVFLIVSNQFFHLKDVVGHIERARHHASHAGHEVSVTAIPYHATDSTVSWLEEFRPPGWAIAEIRVADLSDLLEAAIAASTADLVTVMEPEDIVCEDWFTLCGTQRTALPTCWFPEALVTYGPNYFSRGEVAVFQLPAQLDASQISETRNPMPAGFVGSRAALAAHPFPRADEDRGWGAPGWNDLMRWWWICRLLAADIAFRAMPGTVHYRALSSSDDPSAFLRCPAGRRIGPYTKRLKV